MTRGRILIVDDNAANQLLVKVLLQAEGFETDGAADAREALTAIRAFHPDVILMDVQLPGVDGLEFTHRLKTSADTRDIVVVALTAYAMRGDEDRARAAGCDAYIAKPVDTATLPLVLDDYVARRRAAQRS